MVGRPFKQLVELWRPLFAVTRNGHQTPLFTIKMRCSDCYIWMVSTNGTRKSGEGRIELFICRNPECLKERQEKGFKKEKQFVVSTSHEFKELLYVKLKALYEDLLKDGAKNATIAKKYSVSPSQISALKTEIETAIEKHRTLDSLVEMPQPDRAIAIDETFLRIEGKKVYIIIATGYASRKVLGIKVFFSRNEKDMREVFDEAERNTMYRIATVTSDAWDATISMVKQLGRDITHIIHKHEKPYNKAVIKHYNYTHAERITTEIGVKTDVPKTHAKRQGFYTQTRTPLNPPPSKKRGRPKGSKNKRNVRAPKKKRTSVDGKGFLRSSIMARNSSSR